MILIDHALKRITDHAEQGYPSEVVGILAGDHEAQTVSQVVPLTNLQGETQSLFGRRQGAMASRTTTRRFRVRHFGLLSQPP